MCLIGYSDTIKKASFILIYRGIFMREKFSYNEFLDLIEKMNGRQISIRVNLFQIIFTSINL
jgi:hypothetical protein